MENVRVEVTLEKETIATQGDPMNTDRKSTRLNSSHSQISYAVFCLKKNTDALAELLAGGGGEKRGHQSEVAVAGIAADMVHTLGHMDPLVGAIPRIVTPRHVVCIQR